MIRLLLSLLAIILITTSAEASEKRKKKDNNGGQKEEQTIDSSAIHWMTIDELQIAMKKQPRKVFFDVYTDWCGWCKVMDKKTFSNKEVIKYMNRNFYAVKLNAERQDSILFLGKMYGYLPNYKSHQLAVELLGGRMSYPTSVIMDEQFQNPAPIPGYLDVTKIEKILKYLGENIFKVKQFPEYEKEFTATWTTETGN